VPPDGGHPHLFREDHTPRAPRPPLRRWAREYGPAYAALAALRDGAERAAEALEARLLRLESRRGVLGPAHRAYRGNRAAENREHFTRWDWSAGGEEWSVSEAWKRSVIDDVLGARLPVGGTTLEIGPGAGRWSEALLARADRLVLVDVTDRALELCRARLDGAEHVTYVRTPGAELPGVEDGSVDAVWSFDAFVHIAPVDVARYLEEIARVLRPGGVAVVHHAGGGAASRLGWRAPMSARLFAALAAERCLTVTEQFSTWGGGRHGVANPDDVVTVLRRPAPA
jgi:SAM-dependent methyltransferase